MTLWRKARTEVAGAWRSVRYDLGRPVPDAGTRAIPYGGRLVPRPRRVVAASAFGVLAVAGAAGSYFAVVNGMGSLVDDKPAGAEPYPLAAEAPHGAGGDDLATSGLGRGTAHTAGGRAPVATTTPAAAVPGTVRTLPTTARAAAQVPDRVVAAPRTPRTSGSGRPQTSPAECCLAPPVPTPTAPAPTSHSPSVTPAPASSSPDRSESPEPSESPSSAAPSPSDDATGTPEDENRSGHAGQHRSDLSR